MLKQKWDQGCKPCFWETAGEESWDSKGEGRTTGQHGIHWFGGCSLFHRGEVICMWCTAHQNCLGNQAELHVLIVKQKPGKWGRDWPDGGHVARMLPPCYERPNFYAGTASHPYLHPNSTTSLLMWTKGEHRIMSLLFKIFRVQKHTPMIHISFKTCILKGRGWFLYFYSINYVTWTQ